MIKAYLAKQYAKLYSRDKFIAVSGSVGRSETVRASLVVLSQKYSTVATEPSLDPSKNILKTLFKINPSIQKCILEMGVKHVGGMDSYLSLVRPKTAIITKISYPHGEYLGEISEILQEEGKLLESLGQDGVAILNWDDGYSKKLINYCKGTVLYYGSDPQHCLIWAGNIKTENYRTAFELNLGVERVKINFQLLGMHQIYPALAAAALGVALDLPLTKIKFALESIEAQQHSLQAVEGPNGSVILDDTINSTPFELDGAIDTLLQVPARRRILVLGEMRELGRYRGDMQRKLAQRIYKEKLDFVFLGQGETQIVADELKSLGFWDERMETNLQNSKIVGKLLKLLGRGDVCLINGSKAVRLDEVVQRVSRKD